jgi:hypothetical protein
MILCYSLRFSKSSSELREIFLRGGEIGGELAGSCRGVE